MGPKCALSHGVELARLHVLLELPVPSRGVVLREPLSETSQLFGRELLDLPFNGFYWAHLEQYTRGCLLTCLRC